MAIDFKGVFLNSELLMHLFSASYSAPHLICAFIKIKYISSDDRIDNTSSI